MKFRAEGNHNLLDGVWISSPFYPQWGMVFGYLILIGIDFYYFISPFPLN